MKPHNKADFIITILLSVLVAGLLFANANSYTDNSAPSNKNIATNGDTVYLNSMTIEQKVAQMLIVYGDPDKRDFYQQSNIGGLFLTALRTESDFNWTTNFMQIDAKIPFLISADIEGCVNAFQNFRPYPFFSEINSKNDAYAVGKAQGDLMAKLGIQINFSPVVDLKDTIWKCRSFTGGADEIAGKASSYISGLQSTGTIATAKHYPGRTLDVKDPHKMTTISEIKESDLYPFEASKNAGAKAVMVSHVIASGAVDSEGRPSVVSRSAISSLKKDFTGLVITDDINMLGLKNYYSKTGRDQMLIDLVLAGNDVILDALAGTDDINHFIKVISSAVRRGEIPEKHIDVSVTKILKAKGLKVA